MNACSDSWRALEARRAAVAQHLGQLQPAPEQGVEVSQPVADEGGVGRVQKSSHVGGHDNAVAPPLEIAGVDEHAESRERGALVKVELARHLRRRLRLVEESLDQTDLQGRHENDLRLPLAGEEICAGHGSSWNDC